MQFTIEAHFSSREAFDASTKNEKVETEVERQP